MHYRKLGHTDFNVSLIGLGTMTWGEQNTEAEAHAQLDYAVAHDVNLIDAAEMYPVPPRPETQGRTEQYIGTWLAKTGQRNNVVLATKMAGPAMQAHNPNYLRGGKNRFDKANITEALHDSLKRLQTDYIDLYQLHWPGRHTNTFGRLNYPWLEQPAEEVAIEETLSVLQDFIKQGKIRAIGVSNETPWGLSRFLAAAEHLGLPRIASIQNPYSLLNRSYEVGLSEFSHRENVGLLAYSPLAFGRLTGKYDNGQQPPKGRLTLFERFARYNSPQAVKAAELYNQLARDNGLTPTQLALAYVNSRPFTVSNLIGATTLEQLEENIDSYSIELSAEVLAAIEAIHQQHPNPAP